MVSHENQEVALLKEELYKLQNILTHMPGHVYWKNTAGKYLGCNDGFARVVKLTPPEIAGKSDYDFLEPAKAEQIQKNDFLLIKNDKEITFEEEAVDAENIPAIYLTRKIPLHDSKGEVIGLLGISINITDRKQAEEREKIALAQAAEEKAKAQAETELRQAIAVLAGSIAHDLRAPILRLSNPGYIIKQYWPILMDAYRKAKAANLPLIATNAEQWKIDRNLEQLEKLSHMFEDTTQEMNNFINVTLKTLSKVVQGELAQDDLVLCNIWHCIHNTLERYPLSPEERPLIHWEQRENFDFMGNEILIIRVLSNLLTNALQQIRKNKRGEIFIVHEKSDNINTVRFKDTAGGAPPEIVTHLFDGYRTSKKEGTGIGLAFCKITLNSIGGNITCNSVYGDYIEFILTFPTIPKN